MFSESQNGDDGAEKWLGHTSLMWPSNYNGFIERLEDYSNANRIWGAE